MMTDNIIFFSGNKQEVDVPIDTILEGIKSKLEDMVLIGWDKNEKMIFLSSMENEGEILWLLEKAKGIILSDD